MKKVIVLFMLFPLILFAKNESSNLTSDSPCSAGSISSLQYDSDGSMSIWINNHNYYTTQTNLEPVLFEAFVNDNDVEVYATECYDGAQFSLIKIFKKFWLFILLD